jgi:hypothetical protein
VSILPVAASVSNAMGWDDHVGFCSVTEYRRAHAQADPSTLNFQIVVSTLRGRINVQDATVPSRAVTGVFNIISSATS